MAIVTLPWGTHTVSAAVIDGSITAMDPVVIAVAPLSSDNSGAVRRDVRRV